MSAPNRAAILAKVHKVLKKHYKPVEPPSDRTVLEHLLYAALLENSDFETADECFARLQENFFDWNEVRVTTITELAETLAGVPDATAAAQRVKKTLQSVFETHSALQTHYTFDLEVLKKQNLGKAVAEMEKFQGISPFGVAYATQNALGGHAIACGRGALEALLAVGAINDAELARQQVPGMERAIPKNKGVEFFSLLHQLGVDLTASPQSTRVKGILAEIDPEAKDRLAQWNVRRAEQAAAAKEARDQRIAVAREARAAEARAATKGGAKDKAKHAQTPPPAPKSDGEVKKKPGKPEEKARPAKPPLAPTAKSPAKPSAGDAKGKKPVAKGIAKRKPR